MLVETLHRHVSMNVITTLFNVSSTNFNLQIRSNEQS